MGRAANGELVPPQSLDRLTRFLHLGLAVFGVWAWLIGSGWIGAGAGDCDHPDHFWYVQHRWVGLTFTAFLLARILWGSIGPVNARFANWGAMDPVPLQTRHRGCALVTAVSRPRSSNPRWLVRVVAGAWTTLVPVAGRERIEQRDRNYSRSQTDRLAARNQALAPDRQCTGPGILDTACGWHGCAQSRRQTSVEEDAVPRIRPPPTIRYWMRVPIGMITRTDGSRSAGRHTDQLPSAAKSGSSCAPPDDSIAALPPLSPRVVHGIEYHPRCVG